MNLISTISLLALIVSCGQYDTVKKPKTSRKVESLEGRTNDEILKMKYGYDIKLNCVLRIQEGRVIDENRLPSATFTWDILHELSLNRTLNYSLHNTNYIMVVALKAPLEFLDSLTHIDENNNEYYMEHSPKLLIAFGGTARSTYYSGWTRDNMNSEHVLYENIESPLYIKTTEQDGQKPVTEEVRCILKTKIKPGYENQWVRVK
jgi:hypothetical protein